MLRQSAALTSLSSEASVGGTLELSLSPSQPATGLGLLYLGLDGTDAAGCGFLAPGVGELLLALAPVPPQVGAGILSAGAVAFALPVPDDPAIVGLEVALQGMALDLSGAGVSLELSNALRVPITQ